MPCNVSVRGAFQLTPSARRATATAKGVTKVINISIHALREEGDIPAAGRSSMRINFNPRSPWGERHSINRVNDHTKWNFNPRPPRGERLRTPG